MSIRTLSAAALVVGIALYVGHGSAQPPDFYPPARALVIGSRSDRAEAAQPAPEKGQKLTDLLAKRVSLDKPFEGNFKDAINFLADKFELPVVIDPAVREFGGGPAGCDGLEEKAVKIPRMRNVRTETLLRLTCEQADAMFLVYPDYLRIVPSIFGLYETGVTSAGTDPNDPEPTTLSAEQILKTRPLTRRAIVNLSLKDATVADVLDEIAAASGANVALAPVVAEKASSKITVRFANAPVDVAVRTVCEMADLGMIEDANVLVVTTRERAAARAKLEIERKKAALLALTVPNPGLCLNNQPFIPNWLGAEAADLSAEIAKLKEQNDLLRKQLDEAMKLLKK